MSRRRLKGDSSTPQAEIGPRAFLEPLARILNVSGCHPKDLQREFARICRALPIPKGRRKNNFAVLGLKICFRVRLSTQPAIALQR
jgi:hypothetical protein